MKHTEFVVMKIYLRYDSVDDDVLGFSRETEPIGGRQIDNGGGGLIYYK